MKLPVPWGVAKWAIAAILLVLGAMQAVSCYNDQVDEALAAARDSTQAMTAMWEDARAREDSTSRANDVLRDSLGAVTDSLERARVELAAEREEAAEATTAAGDSLDETLARLREAVRPSVVPLVDTASMQHRREQVAMRRERQVFDREMQNMSRLLATVRDSAATLGDDLAAARHRARAAEEALGAAQDEIRVLRRKIDPPFLVDLWENAEKVGMGAAAALLAREVLN